MSLLQELHTRRHAEQERCRLEVRHLLRSALRRLLPGRPVWVFGSLTRVGEFTEFSDIDLALEVPLGEWTPGYLQSCLSSEVGYEVDVCFLDSCRFADGIRATGERWIV